MKFLSIVLSLSIHLIVIMGGVYSAQFATRSVKVSLGKPVYEVSLVAPAQSISLPSMAPMPKLSQSTPVSTAKMASVKPITIKKPEPEPKAEPISPTKAETKKKPPEKKGPTREEILAQAMKDAQKQAAVEKEKERNVVQDELSRLRQEIKDRPAGDRGGAAGRGGQPSGAEAVYGELSKDIIRNNWRYPVVGSQPNYVAVVEVMVDRSGNIVNTRVTKSSGRPDFDASVLRAVRETEQLEKPPAGVNGFEIEFQLNDLQ